MNEKTILLVEDNRDEQALTVRAFKKNNIPCDLVAADDGEKALELLFGNGADASHDVHRLPVLILLDLKLPKLSGLEVLKRLRADERTRLIPVVILTSSNEQADILKGYSLGANSYIRKPVDFAQFAEAIKQLGLYWLILNESPPLGKEQAS